MAMEYEYARQVAWIETLLVVWKTGDVMVHPEDLPLLDAGLLEAVNGRPRAFCMARMSVKGRRWVRRVVRELQEQALFLS